MSDAPLDAAADPRSRTDARRLKIGGLVLLAAAAGVVGFTGERLATAEWMAAANRARIAWFAGAWVAAANGVALGLILLLAGLRNVPLLRSGRARSGAWTKLAGANLLMVCFAFVELEESIPAVHAVSESWLELPVLVLFIIAARGGIALLRTGWKYEAVSADRLLSEDPRPPVIYVRAFQDDDRIVMPPGGRFTRILDRVWQFLPPFYLAAISPEQELAVLMGRLGPVVAIGKPGERLPELGAARLYVADDRWRDRITDLMRRSQMIVVRAGSTPNLWWEIDQAMIAAPRPRILIVSLGNPKQRAPFDRMFAEKFGAPRVTEPASADAGFSWRRLVTRWAARGALGHVIYFDPDGTPKAEGIRFGLTWTGAIMGVCRPHKDPLESALTRALHEIGLDPVARRSQTAAVLLALFGGIVGLHHFYLGDRRKGYRSLLLAPIGVSVILGVIDGVRCLLLDAQEFDRRWNPGAATVRSRRADFLRTAGGTETG